MAKRQPLSDFAKAQIQARQQYYADTANRVAQDREARNARRSTAEQYLGPNAANMSSRQIDQSFRTGDVAGAMRRTAVEGALADARLGQYQGEMAGGYPLLDTYAINQGVQQKMGGMPQRVPAEGMAAYQQLGGNIASASQLNVPLSQRQSREAQILAEQNRAASALAERLTSEGALAEGLGRQTLATGQVRDMDATRPARNMQTYSNADLNYANSAQARQKAITEAAILKMQQDAVANGGGMIQPPGVQVLQPAPGISPKDQADINYKEAQTRQVEAEIQAAMAADPAFRQRVEAAVAISQSRTADPQAQLEAQRFLQSLFTGGLQQPSAAQTGGLSGQSSTGVPWQLN